MQHHYTFRLLTRNNENTALIIHNPNDLGHLIVFASLSQRRREVGQKGAVDGWTEAAAVVAFLKVRGMRFANALNHFLLFYYNIYFRL